MLLILQLKASAMIDGSISPWPPPVFPSKNLIVVGVIPSSIGLVLCHTRHENAFVFKSCDKYI